MRKFVSDSLTGSENVKRAEKQKTQEKGHSTAPSAKTSPESAPAEERGENSQEIESRSVRPIDALEKTRSADEASDSDCAHSPRKTLGEEDNSHSVQKIEIKS